MQLKTRWFKVSIVFTFLAIPICMFAMGAGHGTYLPATLIFPTAMLIAILAGQINSIAMLVALIQYPLYALILNNMKSNQSRGIAASIIVAVHIGSIIYVMQNKGDSF
jgi:hypothetical protein